MSELQGPSYAPRGNVRRAVVFLHGYGSDGQDLISLAPYLAKDMPDTAFFAPNGPQRTTMGMGYQWFSDAGGTFKDKPGIDKAVDLLQDYLEEHVYGPLNLTPDRVALVGFSMGTMTALHVAPRLVGGCNSVVGFSGKMMFTEELTNIDREAKMPILLIHGMDDDVVPYHASVEAEKALSDNGFDVQLELIENLPHSIDETGINRCVEFLKDNLELL